MKNRIGVGMFGDVVRGGRRGVEEPLAELRLLPVVPLAGGGQIGALLVEGLTSKLAAKRLADTGRSRHS